MPARPHGRNDAAPAPSQPVISARGLTKRYGDFSAVEGLSLDVARGVVIGVIGPSGSGKSTTVRMLTGITEPTSGDVTVFGEPPTTFSARQRARMGYMPQLSVLYPHLSLHENLNFVASIYGLPLRRRARLRRALDFVELGEHRKKLLSEASGGMQRRLALASALVHEPELLFLDEPTAGIDPVLRRKFWDHFGELKRQGRTLVITTQYVGEAAYCDVVAVLADGRLLTVNTPDALRRNAFSGEFIDLVTRSRVDDALLDELERLRFVVDARPTRTDGRGLRVRVDMADTALPWLQEWFDARGIRLETIKQHVPPFDDVFVALVQGASTRG